jgi:gluconolactonase
MTIEVFDNEALRLLDVGATIERIATGFVFTEGALWHAQEQALYFSDIIGDCQHRWDPHHGVTEFRRPSHMANGNTWDLEGRMLSCEHASSRVVRRMADGQLTVLASHYQGLELNSPNDIVVKSDGAIYFTDPIFGRRAPHGVPREPQLGHSSVYRMGPAGGELQRLAVDLEQPNGLCFGLDEKQLYVNDSPGRRIFVYDVQPDGTVTAGGLFASTPGDEPGVPDGMKIDTQGNVYCCGPGGIHVFLPNGHRVARIRLPEKACNFAFGGQDHRTLYVTACTSVYRLAVRASGVPQWRVPA